ncbi:MAG: hypothetical protein ACR2NZ_16280 [Rubripirellula sp.]
MTDEADFERGRSSVGEATDDNGVPDPDSIVDSTRIAVSDDQRAVDEYLSSKAFSRGKVIRGEQLAGRRAAPIRDWLIEGLVPTEEELSPIGSFWFGILGLNAILVAFATLFPVAIHLLETYLDMNETYVFMMLIMQSIAFPALIAFSFSTVTPMFWYGSVLLRFGTGVISVVPGIAAFAVVMILLEEASFDEDFFVGFIFVMIAQFVTAGAVALTVQMWSPWTLSHARSPDTPIPSLGTRSLIELTGIAAFGCAIAVAFDLEEYLIGMLFFAGFGVLSSIGVISVCISFLNRERRSLRGGVVAIACAFATAFLLCGFFATEMFGWESLWFNALLVCGVSLYGMVVIGAVMALCLVWLRSCGWRCVRRDDERERLQAWQKSRAEFGPEAAD